METSTKVNAGPLKRVTATNFLSLAHLDLELGPLNLLVGPNGAGKSNILKAFQFIGDVARLDLPAAIETLQGFENILFRGKDRSGTKVSIGFSGIISEHANERALDKYDLTFWQTRRLSDNRFPPILRREETITIKRYAGRGRRITLRGNEVKFFSLGEGSKKDTQDTIELKETSTGLATLRRLGEKYEAPGIEAIAQTFEQIRLFEIDVNRIRDPRRAISHEALRADAANVATYLNQLKITNPDVFESICEDIRFVLPGFNSFQFTPVGGSSSAFRLDIKEDKLRGATPLSHVSFGTIRAIALFTMLHDPDPPRITCLEEIDHGLHPHALDRLVERIRIAAAKTQLILATHSPALVNRFTPSELIIVERDSETGASRAFHPDVNEIQKLQDETDYRLGELWFSGLLGGGLE
jgi:predicted ATPase